MLPAAVRKWLHRPKRSDPRLLSQFFYADERVTRLVMEINGLDVETDPQQYLVLLNQLHLSQAHLLTLIERLMDECIPKERHCRDYQAKFPEELLVDNLGTHVLFAAECLVAGTVLELEEADGLQLRPLARNLVCSLQLVRKVLREQSLSQASSCSEPVRMALVRFDTLFAEFELSYVASLVSVKSPEELYKQQEIVVLFCETVESRALKLGYLTQDMIDGCEPLLMFTIPRLAIISGLLIYPEGPLSLERTPEEMSRVFSPFHSMLKRIRDLLRVLSEEELALLEKILCAAELEGPCSAASPEPRGEAAPDTRLPASWWSLEPARNCSRHRPACSSETAANPDAGAPGTATGATQRGMEEAKEPVTPGTDPLPERPLNMRTSDVDAACTGSASSGLWPPAKAVPLGEPGRAGDPSRDMWLQVHSAVPAGAGHAGSMGPPWDRSQQSWACSTGHGQLALVASVPWEPTLPGGCVEACVQNRWVRPSQGQALPPLLPGDSSRPLGQQAGSARGRVLCGAVLSVRRPELRSRYHSAQDMIHTLFVCISGVADQLQTNFASDLRSILKTVFHIMTSQPEAPVVTDTGQEEEAGEASPVADCALCSSHGEGNGTGIRQGDGTSRLPEWVPDGTCSQCTACQSPFTVLRRRHHCRSCGKIFCSRCSQHTAPLPHYGLLKPVRVCTHCYTTHLPASPQPLSRP
ncbi:lateral signaling target protein 2 homolog isoform X1 [Gopherus flavomarginatus]|uniref:lateral signaling target protein 2 homolog isoform X1 n=1 Tax=Gopherus flavomarginatus TaxID=286002 RepID=UPI0021CBCF84|nr:lateral signaling target protein 2 homolog isoform X1 [Gopherus flavomarginatus]